jgi:hypothetical protein
MMTGYSEHEMKRKNTRNASWWGGEGSLKSIFFYITSIKLFV